MGEKHFGPWEDRNFRKRDIFANFRNIGILARFKGDLNISLIGLASHSPITTREKNWRITKFRFKITVFMLKKCFDFSHKDFAVLNTKVSYPLTMKQISTTILIWRWWRLSFYSQNIFLLIITFPLIFCKISGQAVFLLISQLILD